MRVDEEHGARGTTAALPNVADGARASAAPLFELNDIGMRFGAFDALADVDVAFRTGEIHCIIGENGAGKSTLCNLVFGIHRPTSGTMMLAGAPYAPTGPRDALSKGVAMVHQHFSLAEELTVLDNLLLGLGFGALDRKREAERVVALAQGYGLSIEPFRKVGDISVGQRQRVEIVRCLMREPGLLILDEPTAVLLPDEIDGLIATCRRVADAGAAVVLVTHKLAEIRRAADRATVLAGGRIAATSERPGEEIDRLVAAMIQRDVNSLDPAMMSALGMSGGETTPAASATPPRARAHQGEAMQADALTYRDADGKVRLDALTFTVDRGEIVGLAGVEGNGQSELGMILAGLERASSGRWFAGDVDLTESGPRAITRAGVGIVPEDRHHVACAVEMSVGDNMLNNRLGGFSRHGLLDRRAMREEAAALMSRFDVRATGPDARFASLSGGNQQKAVLGRELTTPNLKFLLAAQPTRGLDVGAVEAVYGLVREACDQGAGVLLISSELDELIAVADRVLVMYRGRIVGARPAVAGERAAIGAMMAGQKA
ncbi:ABC transporter ATP-binding protein [Acuticoccus sp. MNP-M23]|uniref:ABC transporter ATP-binding protein n=1 Tax=Acuticoccus sp. MNP-M23 TaxID=3072793 RepID=UPI002814F459|nr:ABC transporter ATP-binding protein [Acuticoccus sp. MNP-M23]WMS44548.1 ABC transporter ATP-binding protein [Acuticoccus sp. MNP-M23]